MPTAEVEYDLGLVVVSFEYDAELVEELKGNIPSAHRRWNPNRKAWEFTPTYWDEARRIIGQYCEIID